MQVSRKLPDRFDEASLARELALRIAGDSADGASSPVPRKLEPVIWVDAGDEVVVDLASLKARLLDGALVVSVDLASDQTGKGPVITVFSMGSRDDPAGLFAVTDENARGDPLLASRWGRIVQHAVWASLLGIAQDQAAQRGGIPDRIGVAKGRLDLIPDLQSDDNAPGRPSANGPDDGPDRLKSDKKRSRTTRGKKKPGAGKSARPRSASKRADAERRSRETLC